MEEIRKAYEEIFDSIEDAVQMKKMTPAIILLYTSMDSFSALTGSCMHDPDAERGFMSWVKTWMLEKNPLPCNERDLYSEKCRILCHPVSDQEKEILADAREIYYVSGNADNHFLQNLIEMTGKSDTAVSARFEDILEAFKNAVNDCLYHYEMDMSVKSIFRDKAGDSFTLAALQV